MKTLPRVLLLLGLLALPFRAAALQQWLYVASNLWVDKNIEELESLFQRADRAGFTHVLITDSKMSKLYDMDARYFRNIERVKKLAAENHLELVPALFGIGYSNDLLWKDPNLIEGMPVHDAAFVVWHGEARLEPDSLPVVKGGDFSDLGRWDWHDKTITVDNGAAALRDVNGMARISQKIKLTPFRQYHISVRVKTQNFRGMPEVKVLAGPVSLNHRHLGVKPTQDWTLHHVVFNSLSNSSAQLYLGSWDARGGSVWFDDLKMEEVSLVNLIRRDGAPLTVKTEAGGALQEGRDFQPVADPLMGVKPWKGEYDIYHEPPVIKTSLADGSRLRVSYYHAVTVYDGQANICPSEPATLALLRDEAVRMHRAWGAGGYMMSHDEIRVFNWCDACQKRGLDAGALLADNARTCVRILREVNPGGRIYVWSDMFDPNHNAHKDYFLVRGDLLGSWEGLDKDVIIVPWYLEKRAESLKFFSERGHHQVIAGYYDHDPRQAQDWLKAAKAVSGVDGIMYTTWRHAYKDLEAFAAETMRPIEVR